MKFSSLKTIYPEARVTDNPSLTEEMLSLPYKNKWIQIPHSILSENEIGLLSMVYQTHQPLSAQQHSPWYDYIVGKRSNLPIHSGPIRMIQLKLEKKDEEFDPKLWSESANTLFEPLLDTFFLSDDQYIFIQPSEAAAVDKTEIQGILQTLEEDFSLKTFCYIGQYWENTKGLHHLLQEELEIFDQELVHLNGRIGSLPDVSLRHFTESALENSSIIQDLKAKLETSEDGKELIQALWENQGNISMAAKTLFIHRNTLQYRIEKFYEATGLSLKQINDLALCFLLTL